MTIKLSFIVLLMVLMSNSLRSQSVDYYQFSQDSVIVEMSVQDYYQFKAYKANPEALSVGDVIQFIPIIGDALDRLLGCKCAQAFKDELLFMFLCEQFPDSNFCKKINDE